MQSIPLGHSGLMSSRIGLGTWAIGGALWGARRPRQLRDVGDIAGWHIDDDCRLELDASWRAASRSRSHPSSWRRPRARQRTQSTERCAARASLPQGARRGLFFPVLPGR